MKKYLYLFTLVLLFISCSDKTNTSFEPETEQDIIQYIEDNNLNATRSNSGLYYVINNEGSGTRPTSASNVTVDYKGYFLDGVVFDESNSNGISFRLNEVIQGWTEGITYFREGGNGILLVPYNLGYGESGRGSIPGGSVLIFDIRLISVN
jgi:FKBP-type peptidyl-prolyl cis-trans isomerase FkpA